MSLSEGLWIYTSGAPQWLHQGNTVADSSVCHFLSLFIIIECNMQYDLKSCSQRNMFTGVIDDGIQDEVRKKSSHIPHITLYMLLVLCLM